MEEYRLRRNEQNRISYHKKNPTAKVNKRKQDDREIVQDGKEEEADKAKLKKIKDVMRESTRNCRKISKTLGG